MRAAKHTSTDTDMLFLLTREETDRDMLFLLTQEEMYRLMSRRLHTQTQINMHTCANTHRITHARTELHRLNAETLHFLAEKQKHAPSYCSVPAKGAITCSHDVGPAPSPLFSVCACVFVCV